MGAGRTGLAAGILVLAVPGMWVLGLVLHVWTIVIAYQASGLFSAILASLFPVVAQIFMFIKIASYTGTIMNAYCLAVLGYVVFLAASMWAMKLAEE